MANDRVSRVLLEWHIEQQALKRVIDGNERIRASLLKVSGAQKDLITTADRLEQSFADIARQKGLNQLASDFARGRLSAKELSDELDKIGAKEGEIRGVANEVTRLTDQLQRAKAAAAGTGSVISGGRLQGGALGRLGSELRLLPSIGIPGAGFGTDAIANVLRVSGALNTGLQALGASMTLLSTAAGVSAAALPFVVIAFAELNRVFNDGKRAVEAAIAAQENYYEALATLTSAQARAAVKQLEFAQELLRQQIAETENAARGAEASVRPATDAIRSILGAFAPGSIAGTQGAADAFAQLFAGSSGLQDHLDDLNTEFTENEHTIARLTQGLESLAFAGNDALDFMEREEAIRLQFAQADIERTRQIEQLLASGTREQVQDLIAQQQTNIALIEAEIASYQRRATTLEPFTDELARAETQLQIAKDALAEFNANLQQVTNNARAREAAEEIERDAKRQKDLTAQFGEQLAAAIQQNIDRLAELELAFNQAESDAALKFGQDQADALTKRNDALADIETKAAASRADLEEKYQADREDALAKHNQRLKEIEDDFQKDFRAAVGERDALAAFQAKEERDKLVKRENERFALQQAAREEDFERQKEELQENLDAQRAQKQTDYERQLRDLQTNFDRDKALRQTKYQRDLEQQQRAFENQQALRQQQYNVEYNALATHINNLIGLRNQLLGSLNSGGFTGNQGATSGVPRGGDQFLFGLPGFASGINRVPYTMPAILHKDETVLTARQAAAYRAMQRSGGMGGITVVVNGVGMNRIQIRRAVDKRLNDTLRKSGISA